MIRTPSHDGDPGPHEMGRTLPSTVLPSVPPVASRTLLKAVSELDAVMEEDSPGRKDAQNQHVSPNLPPAGGPRQRRGKPSDSGASAQRRKAAPRATVMRHVQELISGQGKRLDQMTAEERGTLLATAFGPRDSSIRQSSNGDESRPSGQGDVFKVSTTGALMQRMGGPNSRAFRASLERAPRRSIEALDPAIVGSLPQRGASVGRGQDARRADHPMKGIEETEEKDQDRLDRRKDPPARAASGVLTTAHNAAALSRRVASRGALYSGMVPSEGDPDSDSEAPAGDPREKQSNGAAVPPIFAEDSAPKARILGLVGSEGRAKTSKVSARERERELPLWRRFAGVVASHWAMRALNMAGVLCLTVVLMLYRPTEAADSNWNRGMDLAVLVISLVMAALFSIQTAGGIASRRPVFYALELAFLLSGALPYALGAHPGALWALRALQAPRVLRVLTAGGDYDSLHLIMGTLGAAAPLLLQALLLLVFVLLLFTAVALSVFRGASHNRCYSSILGEFEPMAAGTIMGCGGDRACPSDYPECVYGASGRTSRAPGFDNAATAMLTGYEVVTVSGWASSMNQMMDSTSWAASLWFLALVLFGAYLVANVFLAVLEVTLSKVRDQEEGVETLGGLTSASTFGTFASGFSSRKVNGYSAAAKHQSSRASATSKVAPAPGGASSAKGTNALHSMRRQSEEPRKSAPLWWLRCQEKAKSICEAPSFTNTFLTLVVINVLMLAVEHEGMSDSLESVLDLANAVLVAVFIFEAAIKMVAYGSSYFKDGGNVFDFVIALFSALEAFFLSGSGLGSLRALRLLRIFRTFRVMRIFKMFRYLQSLRKVVEVITGSATTIITVTGILIAITLMFMIAGMHLLGPAGTLPNYPTDFATVPYAMRTVLQIMTLEDWEEIMLAYVDEVGWIVVPFFLLIVIVGKEVILGLFIAVMVQAFEARTDTQVATEVKVLAGLKGVQTKSAVAPSAVAPSQGSEAARGAGKGANLPRFTMDRSGEVQSNRPSFHEGSLQGPSMASHRGMPPSSNSVSQEPGIIAVPKQPSLGRQPRTSERSAPGPGVLPASVHGPTTGVLRTSVPSTLGAPHRATGLPPQGRGHRRVSGSGVHGAQSGQVAPPAVAVAAASASARQSSGPDRSLSPSGRAGSVGAPQKQRRPSRLGHGVRVPGAEAANTTRASAGWSQLEDNWRDGSSHRPWLGAQRDAEGPRSDLQRSVTSGQQALAFEAPAHYELQPKASSPPGLSWMSGDASNGHGRGSRGSAPGEAWAGEGGSALGARRTTGGSRGSEPGVRRMTGGSRGSESGARERSQGSQGSEGRPTVTSGTSRGEAWARPVELGANAWAGVGGDGTAVLVDRLGELDSPHLGAGDLHVIEEDDGSLVSDRRSKRSPLPSMSRGARSVFEGRASAQRESILKDEAPQDSALDEVLPVSAAGVATPSASVATGGASFVALESTEGDAEGEMDGARGAGGPVAESQEAWGSGNESSKRGGGGAKGRALGGLVGGLVSSEGDEGEFASARRESVVRFGDVEDLDSGAVGSPRARSHGPGKEARPSRLAVGERAGEGSVSSVKAFQNLREALAKGAERDAGESVVGSSGRAEASGLKPALKKGGEVSEARRKSRLAVEKSRASSFASAKSKKGKGGGLTWGMTQVEGDEDDISIKEPDQLQGMVQMVQELQMLQAEATDLARSNSEWNALRKPRASDTAAPRVVARKRAEAMFGAQLLGGSEDGGKGGKGGKDMRHYQGKSFWLFQAAHPLRRAALRIVDHPLFDTVMSVVIFANCALMVLERPSLEPGSTLDNALWTSEVAFTGVFGAECLLKMLAYTATFYVTDWRNDVDLAIVVTSLLSLTLETAVKDVRAVRSLRVLRAMKPLRAVTRSAGMQVVLRSMVLSIAAVSNVTLVLLLFLVVFAILGVQLFGGAFKTCTDEAVATEASCVGTYVGRDGVELERRWGLHTVYHFDNIGNALLLLFVFATQDGYSDILTRMMVATGSWSVIYFFVVAVVVSFSLLSLFIGVIFFNFTRLKLFSDMGSVFLSARQREWVEINKVMLATKPLEVPPAPLSRTQMTMRIVAQSKAFQVATGVAVMGSMAIVLMQHEGEPGWVESVGDKFEYAFTAVFVAEVVAKIWGFGVRFYFADRWNRFDFLLTVESIIQATLTAAGLSSSVSFVSALRILRTLRFIRLLRSLRGLNELLSTVVASLPALGHVTAVLALVLFGYAYTAVQLFGLIERSEYINEHDNFETFGRAMLTMFRVLTNDDWAALLENLAEGFCGERGSALCKAQPILFFLSFVLLVSIILINMLPTVVIENFERAFTRDSFVVDSFAIELFRWHWAIRSEDGTTLSTQDLEELLVSIGDPLGIRPGASPPEILELVGDLRIPVLPGKRVTFHAVLYELVRHVCYAKLPPCTAKDMVRATRKRLMGRGASVNQPIAPSVPASLAPYKGGSMRRKALSRPSGKPGADGLVDAESPDVRAASFNVVRMQHLSKMVEVMGPDEAGPPTPAGMLAAPAASSHGRRKTFTGLIGAGPSLPVLPRPNPSLARGASAAGLMVRPSAPANFSLGRVGVSARAASQRWADVQEDGEAKGWSRRWLRKSALNG